MGGGGGGTTTVQKADPWSGQQPYLTDVFTQANQMYHSGAMAPDYYAGNTVAPQSQWTQQANQMQADRALNGSASIGNAQTSMDNIVSGGALAGNTGLNALEQLAGMDINAGNTGLTALEQMTSAVNPYSSALLNDAVGQATAQIDSGFSGAGRYGSGAHENARADAIGDLTSSFYSDAYDKQMQAANAASNAYLGGIGQQTQAGSAAGGLYNAGVDTQISGAGMTQELANQAYKDAEMLSQAGANVDAFNQAQIDADIDRWNYNQQKALEALSRYNQLIQGTYGGTSTSTGKTDYSPNALGTAVGAGAVGLGLLDSVVDGGIKGLFS